MNDPYDFHPNHPANERDPVARYGYINPNQLPEEALSAKVDCELDIEEAEKVAQDLADKFGITVTVDVTGENEEEMDALTFDARSEPQFQVGQRVWWQDPAGETSDWKIVQVVHDEHGWNTDSIYTLTDIDDDGETEAYECELSLEKGLEIDSGRSRD